MDERHWWIATKVQETFRLGVHDSPTLFEDFLADTNTTDCINSFLGVGGHTTLFISFPKQETERDRQLSLSTSGLNLRPVLSEEATCLFFLRTDAEREVEAVSVERDILVGEIKSEVLHLFSDLLTNAFLPLAKGQNNWGESDEEEVSQFCHQLEKYALTFQNLTSALSLPQQPLRSPDYHICYDFKQNRASSVNQAVVAEYENLVTQWIDTIEGLLGDFSIERHETLSGPLSEISYWVHRQRTLQSVAEQLKKKECKAVMSVLIAAKSKVLKKWRVVDGSITDAMNETKDKIKYLESLRRPFEDFYHDNTPTYIASTTLPLLVSTIRQMDAITKFYARTGFLGTIFMKITNQLVLFCIEYIKRCIEINTEQQTDNLASVIERDTQKDRTTPPSKGTKKKKYQVQSQVPSEGLFFRLQACLCLFRQYTEMLYHLRDGLGGAHALVHIPASVAPGIAAKKGQAALAGYANSSLSSFSGNSSKMAFLSPSTESDKFPVYASTSLRSGILTGVAFTDDEVMLSAMEPFIHRIHRMVDLLDTLYQLKTLQRKASNLPVMGRNVDLAQKSSSRACCVTCIDFITEESEEDENEDEIDIVAKVDTQQSINICAEISNGMKEISNIIKQINVKTFLNKELKSQTSFLSIYGEFNRAVANLEQTIVSYLECVFSRNLGIKRSLHILSSFMSVFPRPSLRTILTEKFAEVLLLYEQDLHDVQQQYEVDKDNPPLARNAPKAAGCIFWVHTLLRKIEEPMKIFQEIKFVSTLKDFPRITRIYNNIAARLLKYEDYWLSAWKSQIESARIELKAPLLAVNAVSKEIIINCDGRILNLLKEVKWLRRLAIPIPDAALEICKQEEKLKNYFHRLHYLLASYKDLCENVPDPLRSAMKHIMESIRHHFQPAFVTLCWNNTNIDLFFGQVQSALSRLEKTLKNLANIMESKLVANVTRIQNLKCFDKSDLTCEVWSVNEFVSRQNLRIRKVSKSLKSCISEVEDGLKNIVAIINGDSISSQSQQKKSLSGHKEWSSKRRRSTRSNIFSSLAPPDEEDLISGLTLSPLLGSLEDEAIGELNVFFCSQIYDAVLKFTVSSLKTLANCVESPEMKMKWSPEHFVQNPVAVENDSWARFRLSVSFELPDIVVSPLVDSVQAAIDTVAATVLGVSKTICWWARDTKETFHESIVRDQEVTNLMECIARVTSGFSQQLESLYMAYRPFDFLWQDDMQTLYNALADGSPSVKELHSEVRRLEKVEITLRNFTDEVQAGILVLDTTPLKDSLLGFAVAWKSWYSRDIHESAKRDLDELVNQRESYSQQLQSDFSTLDQLNRVLNVLQDIGDMENSIDSLYLPVESTYRNLLSYGVRLPRSEVEEVEALREKWAELFHVAEKVRHSLMYSRRSEFEQELDKQIKGFLVEVVQFRNSFDSQGPGVPGISPSTAVIRLNKFQGLYEEMNAQRKILSAVQQIFGNAVPVFPELDKTGEELELLGLLYGLFQRLIAFDEQFRDKLWAEVHLSQASDEMHKMWDEANALPDAVQCWSAFKDMKNTLQFYLEVLPLLQKLASKEIRNRHWLQVMAVTGSSFQLEANILKLSHLLDIDLVKKSSDIETIVGNARKELGLEVKLKAIEEDWTEQVLSFASFKHRGLVCLDKAITEKQIDLLEDAKGSLAVMLTSKHIEPMRDTAAGWAVKLKEIGEVLEQWLVVQELWKSFEEVFCSAETVNELPQEYARFSKIDRTYIRMIKKAVDTKNILQCCIGGDVPKSQMLKGLNEELELCFKSLSTYLDKKREEFPRFYFVSNSSLLSILCKPYNLESITPYLRDIFSGIRRIETLTISKSGNNLKALDRVGAKSSIRFANDLQDASIRPYNHEERRSSFRMSFRLDSNVNVIPSQEHFSGNLEWRSHLPTHKMVAIEDEYGETLKLGKQVAVEGGVQGWLSALQLEMCSSVQSTIRSCLGEVQEGKSVEEWVLKYPAQVSIVALLHLWTKECELGISDIRTDRKALSSAIKRFGSFFNKILQLMSKGHGKTADPIPKKLFQNRLGGLLLLGLFLRDVADDLGKRKLRDVMDFDWQRNLRLYHVEEESEDEPRGISLQMHDAVFIYGYEFLGSKFPVVLTPLTDRCFLTLTQAISKYQAGNLCGTVCTGKTQIIKGLSYLLGNFLFSIAVLPEMELTMFGRILLGAAKEGCWCLLVDLHRASMASLSVLMFYAQHFMDSLRTKEDICYLSKRAEVEIRMNYALFATTASHEESKALPKEVSSLFRTVYLSTPDNVHVLRAFLACNGFKTYKVLAEKLQLVADIATGQLSSLKRNHFGISNLVAVVRLAGLLRGKVAVSSGRSSKSDGSRLSSGPFNVLTFSQIGKDRGRDKKSNAGNQLGTVAKTEQKVILQAVLEYVGARLPEEERVVLMSVGKSVFGLVYDQVAFPIPLKREEQVLESCLKKRAQDLGWIAQKSWISKSLLLYHLSKIHSGLILCGRAGTGKTSCLQNLVESLSEVSLQKHGSASSQVHTHRLERINIMAVSDLSQMFGGFNQQGDWEEGVFSSLWKRANRQHSVHLTTSWLCFDAPVHDSWSEDLKNVVDGNKCLTLSNLERWPVSQYVKIVIETDNVKDASPSILATMGMVYMDEAVLGWKPLAEAWLTAQPKHQSLVFQRVFNKVMDPVTTFIQNEVTLCHPLSETALFSACLDLLSALLKEHPDIGGDFHIERLFLFSLIWTFGGMIKEEDERHSFSQLMLGTNVSLPDYDHEISVFDYYVDESGEWDHWESRLQEACFDDSVDLHGEIFVETRDTMRVRFFMELGNILGKNVMVVGPRGSGKTTVVNHVLEKFDMQQLILKRLVFSASSSAQFLQNFLDSSIHHRQGFIYGAKEGKTLHLFIDDLQLPAQGQRGIQPVNELLRQVLDQKMVFNLRRPFDRRYIEGLTVTATMTPPAHENDYISERLLRHFLTIQLPHPNHETCLSIFSMVLEANMTFGGCPGLAQDLHDNVVHASNSILQAVQDVLRCSSLPGRENYCFSMKNVALVFQSLQLCPEELRGDEEYFVSFWLHEIRRTYEDQVSQFQDMHWLNSTIKLTTKQYFPELPANVRQPIFITFASNAHFQGQRSTTGLTKGSRKRLHEAIKDFEEVRPCISNFLQRYSEEFGTSLPLVVSSEAVKSIVRIHRMLSNKSSSNALLVGSVGTHLASLVRLALFMMNCPLHEIDCTSENTFREGLKVAIRAAACEGQQTAVIMTASELSNDSFLEILNSLLVCGEYPSMFSDDEMQGLVAALMPVIKRKYPSYLSDPSKFFITQLRLNLSVILCFSPDHPVFLNLSRRYPGIISNCQVCRLTNWTQEALVEEAQFFFAQKKLLANFDSKMRDDVISILAAVHGYVLRECDQILWHDSKKKEDALTPEEKFPSTLKIIVSKITKKSQYEDRVSAIKIGPTSYQRLLHCFQEIFNSKLQEVSQKRSRRRKALKALEQTREDVAKMKARSIELKEDFQNTTAETARLLELLISKATLIERLKAKFVIGANNSLNAFMDLIESEMVEEDEDVDFLDDFTELDEEYERIRSAQFHRNGPSLELSIEEAKVALDRAKAFLDRARSLAESVQKRIDRGCIERLRGFQSPPPLVGIIVLMITVLIRRPEFSSFTAQFSSKAEKRGDQSSMSDDSPIICSPTGRKKRDKNLPSIERNVDDRKKKKNAQTTAKRESEWSDSIILESDFTGLDGRIDKATWKTLQGIMSDTQKFAETLSNFKVMNVIPVETLKAVIAFFAPGEELPQYEGSKLAPSSMTCITPRYSSYFVNPRPGPMTTQEKRFQGITLAGARHSSEDAAHLVEFVQALVDCQQRIQPFKRAEAHLRELTEELEEEKERLSIKNQKIELEFEADEVEHIDPIKGLTAEDLSKLSEEVEDLQKEFDDAALKKHNLQKEIEQCTDRLKAVVSFLDGLEQLQQDWTSYVQEYENLEVLLGNSIKAAAYITYCGQLGIDQRKDVRDYLLQLCNEQSIQSEKKRLFEDISLETYIVGKLTLLEWETIGIPKDPLSLENIAIATTQRSCDAWPLIYDRLGLGLSWLQSMLPGHKIIKFRELKNELDSCLTEGSALVLTGVVLKEIGKDKKLRDVIKSRKLFTDMQSPFKILVRQHIRVKSMEKRVKSGINNQVGGEEVECSPKFQLFMITHQSPASLPFGIAEYLNVVDLSPSRQGLARRLLLRFIELEKPRIYTTLLQVSRMVEFLKKKDRFNRNARWYENNDMHKHFLQMTEMEEVLLSYLGETPKPLDNLQSIKKIKGTKRQYDEALDSLIRTKEVRASVEKSMMTYKPVAVRGSVMLDVAQAMRHINPFYEQSIQPFLWTFDASIKHSERNAITAVVDRLQLNTFLLISRGLLEEDKILFGLIVALEVSDSLGKVDVGDREFLVSPPFGAAVKMHGVEDEDSLPKGASKKPFDWLLDEQYHNLQLLAHHFDWFSDAFDRMTKDGKEMQWRQLAEHERPELVSLPDNLDEKYTPVQRLMVIRALRSDRLIQASAVFIQMVLGKRYASDTPLDLNTVIRQTTNRRPVLLVYREEAVVAERAVSESARTKQITLRILRLPYLGEDSSAIKSIVQTSISEGFWVLILNFRKDIYNWHILEVLLEDAKFVNPGFRLWISVQQEDPLPWSLLHDSPRLVVDTPIMSIREALPTLLSWTGGDIWQTSSRGDWAPLLHNLCMLHTVLRFRTRFGLAGYNRPWESKFTVDKFWEAVSAAVREFRDAGMSCESNISIGTNSAQRGPQWNALRYLCSEIIYGSCITDSADRATLSALVDFWINSQAAKKDQEMTRAKYKLPFTCFHSDARHTAVMQSLEAIEIGVLDMPEICGLHPSDETILSYDQYVFSRLNLIYDRFPSSSTLMHLDVIKESIPSRSAPLVVSSGSSHALGAGLIALTKAGVFASASMIALTVSKQADLHEVCAAALSKLPKLWSKDFISERIKKTGSITPFNMFLLAEIEDMFVLHHEVKTSLQMVQDATTEGLYGDRLPEHMQPVAEDLYYMKVPKRWCELAGDTSLPSVWGLNAWLSDLQHRFTHLEKVIMMGREKLPAYWLAAFFKPKRLLSVILEEAVQTRESKTSVSERHVLRTEITGRDKEHLREPPSDGIFIYGTYLWGCSWEKTSSDIQDVPPRVGPSPLPVIHITAVSLSEKNGPGEGSKSSNAYEAPCFVSRICRREQVMAVDIEQRDVPASRWPLRGVACTLRPF